MKKTLVRAGWLVSMDAAIGTITGGEMLIEGDKILAVGKNLDASAADEIVDKPGMILMPGIVNAHMHTWQTGLRAVGVRWGDGDYFKFVHDNMATRYNAEDTYLGTLIGALNQIDNGVTTLFDWCHILRDLEMAERNVDALQESGIRAMFAHGTAKPPARPGEVHHTKVPHPRDRVEALRKTRFTSNDQLVTLGLAVLGPEMSTPEVTMADYRLAKELDLVFSCHSSFPPQKRVQVNGWTALAEAGLLGPNHNICHGNALPDEDLQLVLDHGVTITPTVMLELQMKGVPPLTVRIRDRGAMPSLGIDTEPLNSGDMFNEIRTTWLHYRHYENRVRAEGKGETLGPRMTPHEVLTWATIGGARMMRMENKIGSLTPGKQADFILLDGDDLDLFPVYDPVVSVVSNATGGNVDTVYIAGQAKKQGGKLLFPADVLAKRKTALVTSAARIISDAGLALPIL
jgi:cytosine/adenosine deaminase-related metal-dependent hydrolase